MAYTAYFLQPDGEVHRRHHVRRTLRLSAAAKSSYGRASATIHDLSQGGMLLATATPLQPGEIFEVELPGCQASVTVVWQDASFVGCQFLRPLTRAQVSAALLRSDPAGFVAQKNMGELADALIDFRRLEVEVGQLKEDLERRVRNIANPLSEEPQSTPLTESILTDEDVSVDDRLSFSNRLRILLAATVMAWCVILWAVGVL